MRASKSDLARKLAIVSLRYCVSYYSRAEIDQLAYKIREVMKSYKRAPRP